MVAPGETVTDTTVQVEEVKGPGVVGDQAVLAPGESGEYTSFCPLTPPFGIMEDSSETVTEDEALFPAAIARYALSGPLAVNRPTPPISRFFQISFRTSSDRMMTSTQASTPRVPALTTRS